MDYIQKLQLQRYELFKTQNPEIGQFDVIFEIEGKLLYAQKHMLTMVSDTAAAMLSERWTSKDEPVKIEGNTFVDFEHLIHFCYSGECLRTPENINTLIDMAEFYNVAFFKSYCDEYASAMECSFENVFPMLETAAKYSMPLLKETLFKFVVAHFADFTSDEKCSTLDPTVVKPLIEYCADKISPEDLFRFAYKWSEQQVIIKDAVFNFHDAIKDEISPLLPHILFNKMKHKFVLDFVVKKGFIFSHDQLSEILLETYKVTVKVTNSKKESITGKLFPDYEAVCRVLSLKGRYSGCNSECSYWGENFQTPSNASQIKKADKDCWYLIYYSSRYIGISHSSKVNEGCYIICEMIPDKNFSLTGDCKIDICD